MERNCKVVCFIVVFSPLRDFSLLSTGSIACPSALQLPSKHSAPASFPVYPGLQMGSPLQRRNPALPPSLLSFIFPAFSSCCCFLMSKSQVLEGVQGQIQKCAASILISYAQNQPSSHLSNKCCTDSELEMSPAPSPNAANFQPENIGHKLVYTHTTLPSKRIVLRKLFILNKTLTPFCRFLSYYRFSEQFIGCSGKSESSLQLHRNYFIAPNFASIALALPLPLLSGMEEVQMRV